MYNFFFFFDRYAYGDGRSGNAAYWNHFIRDTYATRTTSSGTTGISVTVGSVKDTDHCAETRPKNMAIVYIMKVC